jgi:C-terminal processing protease CtpA/Prc
MKKLLIIFFLVVVIFSSCKKDVPPVVTVTVAEEARDALYDLMKEWYYWYKDLPTVTMKTYKDPYELMTALRYKPLDRWSFVADYDSFVASMQGTFVGHGIRIGLDAQGKARIVTIYNNSPLYSKGVRRGWIIKKLNGTDLAPILASGDGTAYNNLIGPATAGVTNTFIFQIPDGRDSTFITPSSQELQTAFAFFKAQNVKDLILDMRYNNGGILTVATELASYIAGTAKFSTPFVTSSYNDKLSSTKNSTTNFTSVVSPLNLTRLVVITTRETASASEVIINGLKPHMTVTTIGDTTNGKPTGMDVFQYDYKYILAPITFKLVNSAGQGDFFNGFAPAKYVTDDITRDFKDKNEYCFKEAIYFLTNGTVSTKGTYIYKPSIQYSEKPAWMNNLLVPDKSLIH